MPPGCIQIYMVCRMTRNVLMTEKKGEPSFLVIKNTSKETRQYINCSLDSSDTAKVEYSVVK